jgi:prevent-host-death family protein
MVPAINVHAAKTNFSKLIKRVQSGEEVVIAKAGKPVARLVPYAGKSADRQPGSAKGQLKVSSNFDAPLPKDLREAFGM